MNKNRNNDISKAVVIISYKVDICTLDDKVVYMKEGKIGAVGSYQELMECCEEYKGFYNEQAKWHYAENEKQIWTDGGELPKKVWNG